MNSSTQESPSSVSRQALPVLLLAAAVIVISRLFLLTMPLERDEGEYAYIGAQILEGEPPYLSAYNMKYPGTSFLYAGAFAVAGKSAAVIRLLLMLSQLLSAWFMFRAARRYFEDVIAACAALTLAVLISGTEVYGQAGHATQFVTCAGLGALAALHKGFYEKKIWPVLLAGVGCGLAMLFKQPGILFLPLCVLLLWSRRQFWETTKQLGWAFAVLLAGFVLPFSAMLFYLYAEGALGAFHFWTNDYGLAYARLIPLKDAPHEFASQFAIVLGWAAPVWVAAAAGLIWNQFAPQHKPGRKLLLAWISLMFLAAVPGFNFHPHYFVPLLPAVAMGTALLLSKLSNRKMAMALLGLALVFPLGARVPLFLSEEPSRRLYGYNPFPEAEIAGSLIKEMSSPEDQIAVIGSEPEILFYADRKSATGFVYFYTVSDNHRHQEKFMERLEKEISGAKPRFIVMVKNPVSLYHRPGAIHPFFGWLTVYLEENAYQMIAVTEPVEGKKPLVIRGEAASRYKPRTNNWIGIFERK